MKRLLIPLMLWPAAAGAFELIAHRGVHQTYHRQGLTNETCTASRILHPTHDYLENTLASVEKAFDLGADVVEVDVHATREEGGAPPRLAVFHDWTLDCRTDARCDAGCRCSNRAECVTHDQSLQYLQTLDIGYGYTYDGQTFPFRGKTTAKIPSFDDVLKLLEKHRGRKILVDLKDDEDRTHEAFLAAIGRAPADVRERVLMDRRDPYGEKYAQLGVPDSIHQSGKPMMRCLGKYVLIGWAGIFPSECRGLKFFVPINETLGRLSPHLARIRVTDLLWGWPDKFLQRAREGGAKVYLSGVDTEEDFNAVQTLPVEGIMTNRIEVIAPLLKR